MYMYKHIYIHTYMHVHTHIFYACHDIQTPDSRISIRTCIHTHPHMYTHMYTYAHSHILCVTRYPLPASIHICTHILTHIYVYTQTYSFGTHKHTYIDVLHRIQGGQDSWDPLSLQVIFRKSDLYSVVRLWKMM